jgi:hypothetical protein
MILASAPLKNGRNDYVFNIDATARLRPEGGSRPQFPRLSELLTPFLR